MLTCQIHDFPTYFSFLWYKLIIDQLVIKIIVLFVFLTCCHVMCVLCLQIEAYTYYGTNLDSMDHLNYQTNHHTSEMTAVAAQFAGQMALRLIHDRLLNLDVSRYSSVVTSAVGRVNGRISQLKQVGLLPFYALVK